MYTILYCMCPHRCAACAAVQLHRANAAAWTSCELEMLRSWQSDAANFMDIGRISAAIKRKVIELVEKGLSRQYAYVGVVAVQGQSSGGAEKKIT